MLKDKKIHALTISLLACMVYALWLAPLKPLQIANLKIIDIYYNLSSRINGMPKSGAMTAVVAIDDESLRRVNMRWPWSRSVMADIINKISSASPRLILLDLVFAGKSVDPAEDLVLINALKNAGNVLGAAYFGTDGKYVMPDETIALNLSDFGFVNKPRDADNAVRRMRPYFLSPAGDIIDYSLSLKTASCVLNLPPGSLALSLPLAKGGAAYIKFFGSPHSGAVGKMEKFNIIPVWKVMESSVDPSSLKDKVVFLGITAESFHDTYNTPLGMMPGLILELSETLTYINKSFFRYAAGSMNFTIIFIFVLMASAVGMRLTVLEGAVFSAMLIAASFFFGFWLFLHNIITDSFGSILLIIISTIAIEGSRSILLAVENIVLKKEAITDGLTGLYVYRYFELQLKRQVKDSFQSRKKLALVIYDIDYFKKINDAHGHEFGNTILKSIAKNLKDHSRKNNIIARYGGEEFCIIVPGMDRRHAVKYAERLRNLVGLTEFKTDKGEIVKITLSGGIAMAEDILSGNPADLVKAADRALYGSKDGGRNKISVFYKNVGNV